MNLSFMNKVKRSSTSLEFLAFKQLVHIFLRPAQCMSVILTIIMVLYIYSKHSTVQPYACFHPSTTQSSRFVIENRPLEMCAWKFDHYAPSSWEKYWHSNIDELQNNICSTLKTPDQMKNSVRALERIISLQRSNFKGISTPNADDLFSKMVYRQDCMQQSSSHLVEQEIEPLIGLLRDPLTICEGVNSSVRDSVFPELNYALQSKRFLLLAPSAPYINETPTSPIPPWIRQSGGQNILFDIGSSLFNELEGTTEVGAAISSRWFYEYFKNMSLQFDRIIAFERGQKDPTTVWAQLPEDLLPIYTFINVGVEPNGKLNPWKILERIAKPNDYVIIKLDIDVSDIEKELINQILDNPAWRSLIDEMFFEMHVNVKDMKQYWGRGLGTLRDAYDLFSKLRKLGIRMHSWP